MARTDKRPNYGDGRRARGDGYIDVWKPDHPMARADGYVFEHRLIAWELGLLKNREDVVHHVNGDRTDNRPSNLEVKSNSDHSHDHVHERGHVANQYGVHPVGRPVPPPKTSRPCQGCSGTVPATARRDARFCSSNCQVAAWKRSAKAKLR